MPDSPDVLTAPTAEDAADFASRTVDWLLSSGITILVIIVVASVLSFLISWLLRRFFHGMVSSSSALSSVAGAVVKRDRRSQKTAQARREQRAQTLSNVARNITHMAVWSIALMMILSEVGVNIAPVIASLGVVGLAAGMGAQALIKDFLAGLVMLFEDLIAVGDVVDLDVATGTVVQISLRTTQLRSLDGTLWTISNGEIMRIANKSRGYSKAMVELGIDVKAEDGKVADVLDTVTTEFAEDERWHDLIVDGPKVSGILGDDGERYRRRVEVQLAPGEQWEAQEDLRRRFRDAFRAAEIPCTMPEPAATE